METIKLLIADGSEEFRLSLEHALRKGYCVRSCGGGKDALTLLHQFHPDVLVLDLMLPELDGISLLKAAAADHIMPLVLATTRYVSDYLLDAIDHLGVSYLMVKPCDVEATVCRIEDMAHLVSPSAVPPPAPRELVKEQLHILGISSKLNGFSYLLEAIPLFARQPGISITKELYPAVASLCGGKSSQVERSIRNAIQTAWQQREDSVWQSYFHTGGAHRPTNAEFISRLAELLPPFPAEPSV